MATKRDERYDSEYDPETDYNGARGLAAANRIDMRRRAYEHRINYRENTEPEEQIDFEEARKEILEKIKNSRDEIERKMHESALRMLDIAKRQQKD